MREKILISIALIISFGIGFMTGQIILIKTQKPSGVVQKVIDRSLEKYTIDNLSKADIKPAIINKDKLLKDFPNFTSNEFTMEFNPNPGNNETKKVSGMLNIPKKGDTHPLLVMIRGFVSPKDYFIGNGTINASYYFANNGYITISPDFLGYGDSDKEPDNVFEARFQTYTTVLSLLRALQEKKVSIPEWDKHNVFIWAHSNGGQIALTTLEITRGEYPTILWAPVSAPFPFSILYYSDESDDKGKSLRKAVSQFEDVYNSDLFSLDNYLSYIKAPIQLNQGTSDDAVPVSWSDNLAKILKDNGVEINYNKYLGADHQMSPLWNEVIRKDLEFFNGLLEVLPH